MISVILEKLVWPDLSLVLSQYSASHANFLAAMSREFGCKNNSRNIGILVAQLGTPEAPTKAALRPYLKQFLSDPRVIEVNRALWWFILNVIILNTRPKRSAALYKNIWRAEGSPLLITTKQQAAGIEQQLRAVDPSIEVAFGMRYGSPSIESALDQLIAKGCTRILLFPMYPQYAAATTASTYDVVFPHLLKRRFVPTLRVAEPYFDRSEYIDALAATINRELRRIKEMWGTAPERLVLSYHGIPLKYVQKGDPYCCQCTETTRLLRPKIEIEPGNLIHTYQSRFGKDPWLEPYTDETITKLGKQGIKRIAVAAPGFPADCLETIDELGRENHHIFQENGGEKFAFIPGLNDSAEWISGASKIVLSEIDSWLKDATAKSQVQCPMAKS